MWPAAWNRSVNRERSRSRKRSTTGCMRSFDSRENMRWRSRDATRSWPGGCAGRLRRRTFMVLIFNLWALLVVLVIVSIGGGLHTVAPSAFHDPYQTWTIG